MEIVLTGTGSPLPDPKRAGPSTLVKAGDTHVLVDAGSNMTGASAEELGRKWLAYERDPDYLDGSVGRFEGARGLDDSPRIPRELSGRPARWWKIPQ